MIMKIERETIKCEIGNFMILMKYYIAKERRRNFLSWDSFKTAKTIYIYIKMEIERETHKYEIVNFVMSMKYYIVMGNKIQYFISWDTCKSANPIYIYINEDWERDNQIRDWKFHDINEILYHQKKKTIFYTMRYIKSRVNDIYIYFYTWKKERETIQFEIGNFMILMKHYIAKRRRRYSISWDTSKTERMMNI